MTEQFDLEEQQEQEQFSLEDNQEPSGKVKMYLREKKLYEKQYHKETSKHRATFKRIKNQNGYVCDNCGKEFMQEEGTLMYKKDGEFAYCKDCLKELYPNYRHIKLAGTVNKADRLSNHYDTKYFFNAKMRG